MPTDDFVTIPWEDPNDPESAYDVQVEYNYDTIYVPKLVRAKKRKKNKKTKKEINKKSKMDLIME